MKGLLNKAINAAFSPKAFSTYAVIGVGVTVTMAILNTRKQCKKEFEKKSQEGYLEKELTREDVKEEIKDTVKTYIPTATVTPWIDFQFREGEDGVIYIYPEDWLNPPMRSPDRSPLAYGYMLHPYE